MNLTRTCLAALLATAVFTVFVSTANASVLNVHDEGHVHFITSYGSEIIDEGPATGSVPGTVKVYFVYDGNPAVSARFTITTHAGSISGRANGRLSSPTSFTPSFHGAFKVTTGTGRYRHIHGIGELFGVFFRHRHYAMIVQTLAKLTY